ncbi:MAG: ABC transporter ATP-binding protein [Chloroflexi bacterium]|nr:ABC transporter ATP-binding protein [Chloroflexota bacterium]
MRTLGPTIPYLRRHKLRIAVGLAAILAATGFSLLQPYILRLAVDALRRHTTLGAITQYVAFFLLAAAGQAICLFIQRSTINRVSRFVEYDLRNDAFVHLQSLDQGFYAEMHTGDLMARLTNDLNAVRQYVGMGGLLTLISTGVTLVGVVVLMIAIDWKLALTAFAVLPFVSLSMVVVSRTVQSRFRAVQDQFGQLSTNAQENISGIRVVKAFTQEGREIEAFARANEEYVQRNLSYVRLSGIMWPLMTFVMGIALALVLYVGGVEVANRQITLGQFVQFNGYLALLSWPMIGLGWVINVFQQAAASMARIMEVMTREPDIRDTGRTLPLRYIRGEIEFRDVGVRRGDTWVLRNVSFTVPRGTTTAIVGMTGVGKTTLMSLVPRVLEADEGQVLIDGVDVRRIPLETIRRAVGFVPQDTFLFSATLRENTMFGVDDATPGQLEHAITVSRLSKDLEQFPRGLDTVVGERGVSLSGGQKQRTALARALLRNPTILILDDAMSSVDTHTQSEILEGLRGVMAERTTLITSMRISTIKGADQIVVLDDAGIVERGTHRELLLSGGLYSRMYRRELLRQELEVDEE